MAGGRDTIPATKNLVESDSGPSKRLFVRYPTFFDVTVEKKAKSSKREMDPVESQMNDGGETSRPSTRNN